MVSSLDYDCDCHAVLEDGVRDLPLADVSASLSNIAANILDEGVLRDTRGEANVMNAIFGNALNLRVADYARLRYVE